MWWSYGEHAQVASVAPAKRIISTCGSRHPVTLYHHLQTTTTHPGPRYMQQIVSYGRPELRSCRAIVQSPLVDGAGPPCEYRQPIATCTATCFKTPVKMRPHFFALRRLSTLRAWNGIVLAIESLAAARIWHVGLSVARFVWPRGQEAEVCCSPTTYPWAP
jgi:hypothetical protein